MLKSVSVIVPFKNRDYSRVKNYLDSITNQNYDNLEIIFVNQGSDNVVNIWLEKLIENYLNVKYIYNNTQGYLWNKSEALNIAIKNSNSDLILVTDVDLIFTKHYVSKLVAEYCENVFLTPYSFYLEEKYYIELNKLIDGQLAPNAIENFIGVCLVSRKSLIDIHGYDENYIVWGAEDDDIIKRLQLLGLVRKVISASEVASYHQWHKSLSPNFNNYWYLEIVNYLYSSNQILRNVNKWGELVTLKNRLLISNKEEFEFDISLKKFFEENFSFFNDFIKTFYDIKIKSGSYTIYISSKKSNIGWFKSASKLNGTSDQFQICLNFFNYFLFKNKELLYDYYFFYDVTHFDFKYLKK